MDRNWAGNVTFTTGEVASPRTVDEVAALVAGAASVAVVGTGHAFNRAADGPVRMTVADIVGDVEVAEDRATVTVPAGWTYTRLAARLHADGLALANLASLPDISIGGAIASATHGSGRSLGNLATAVAAVELVTADGVVRWLRRGDEQFAGVVAGMGCLGVVTRVVLDVEPTYEVRQRFLRDLPWSAVEEDLPAVMDLGYSVSVLTPWHSPTVSWLWVKERVDAGPGIGTSTPFGGVALDDQHDPGVLTPQLGVPGPWHERLPHFRTGARPRPGPELQSEWFVAADRWRDAVQAMREIGPRLAPAINVTELRWVAADDLWLSPQYGQDTLAVHITWHRDQEQDVQRAIPIVHEALSPLGARVHLAKMTPVRAADMARLYPRHADFVDLANLLDPSGVFRNAWAARVLFGA